MKPHPKKTSSHTSTEVGCFVGYVLLGSSHTNITEPQFRCLVDGCLGGQRGKTHSCKRNLNNQRGTLKLVAAWVKQSDLGPLEVIFFCRTFSDDKKIASENTTDWAPLRWNLIQALNFIFNCGDVFTVFYGTEISHVPFVTSP